MNLTLHIVKKDLRRFWPGLLGWWGLLLFIVIFPVWAPASLYQRWADDFAAVNAFQCLTDLIFATWVVNTVLMDDLPVNDRAHWQTLPVSRLRMLGAKAIFLFVFCLLVPGLIVVLEGVLYRVPENRWWYDAGVGWVVFFRTEVVFIACGLTAVWGRRTAFALLILLLGIVVLAVPAIILLNFLWPDDPINSDGMVAIFGGLAAILALAAGIAAAADLPDALKGRDVSLYTLVAIFATLEAAWVCALHSLIPARGPSYLFINGHLAVLVALAACPALTLFMYRYKSRPAGILALAISLALIELTFLS